MDNNISTNKPSLFFWRSVFLFLVLIGFDQLAKHLARREFYNYGFAFSLPLPQVLIFPIYIVVVAAMIYYVAKYHRQFSTPTAVAWTLIFAGATSNIFERIFLGFVRDFIFITVRGLTGVYNLADFYILLGIAILIFKRD